MSNQRTEDKDEQDAAREPAETEHDSTDEQHGEDDKGHGEGHGNLKRRSDWFQKRHGGG
jgi:hypothetical protein